MPQVNVEINGRTYKLTCGEGEQAHVLDLSRHVDRHAKSLGKSTSPAAESRVLVMAGLMLADEVYEATAKIAQLEAQIDALKSAPAGAPEAETEQAMADLLNRAAEEIETVAERLVAQG